MREWDEEDLCLVALAATDGVGPATIARLRATARAARLPLAEVLKWSPGRLVAEAGLRHACARAAHRMADPAAHGRAVLGGLARLGIRAVLAGRRGYPARLAEALGEQAPAVLFLAGSGSLLERPCLAIVGSRQPSRQALDAARTLARGQAGAGVTVVSGGASGIDSAAHAGAMEAGGTAVVPALGLAHLRWRGPRGAAEGSWCAVGQFPPQAPWRAAQALLRNRTIVALSRAVVAFEPRDGGGTFHSSMAAIAMRKPLFVVAASRRGAKARGLTRLVRLGAVALDAAAMPNPDELDRLVAEYRPVPCPDQLLLFEPRGPY